MAHGYTVRNATGKVCLHDWLAERAAFERKKRYFPYICMCVYVYMYVCDCVYVYIHTHTHTHTHTHKIFFEDCGLLNVLPNVTTVFFVVVEFLSPHAHQCTHAHMRTRCLLL